MPARCQQTVTTVLPRIFCADMNVKPSRQHAAADVNFKSLPISCWRELEIPETSNLPSNIVHLGDKLLDRMALSQAI